MAIIELQRRQTEVGRIRLGQKVQTKSGKTAPARLETFRFTSPSRPLIDAIARLYGGDVQSWSPPKGASEWEVITTTNSVPVVVPPQDVDSSQFYELWSAGGCVRRCTGVRELIGDTPCVCEPTDRECKMHTRVNLMLRDVPGIGVWRLDTGGFYAGTELPGMVALLSRAQGLVPALLELRQRTVTRNGETKHFVVPVLHVEDFTPGQLIAGEVIGTAIEAAPERPAIESGPALTDDPSTVPGRDWKGFMDQAQTVPALREVWKQMGAAGITGTEAQELKGYWWRRKAAIEESTEPASGPATVNQTAAAVDGDEPDRDDMWTSALRLGGERNWTTADVSRACREFTGKDPADANGWELEAFRDSLKTAVPA